MPSDRAERLSPTSPRLVHTDATPPARSITIQSPGMLSPSRALGGQNGNAHRMGRSHRDDQVARDRQMQQDIDSAMSMSRARSGSILGEPSPGVNRSPQAFFPGGSPIDESPFPMLSEAEEAEMDRARRSGFRDDDLGSDDGHGRHNEERQYDRGDEDEGIGGGRSMGSSGFDSHRRLLPEEHHRNRPDGMPQPARNRYDFAAMEDFALKEREALGKIDGTWPLAEGGGGGGAIRHRKSTGAASGIEEDISGDAGTMRTEPQSYDTNMERTNTMSAYGDDPDSTVFSPKESDSGPQTQHGHQNFRRRRQRKLSQSNPITRRGGRLALFEGFGLQANAEEGVPASAADGAAVAYKSRAPKNPLSAAQGTGFAPYTDAPAGHDRPYRFSFYSNNLPVTIHARTLAELPAEGQTFEDLFKGRATMDETRGPVGDGSGLEGTSVDSAAKRSMAGTDTPDRDPNMAQPNGKVSLLARGPGAASRSSVGGAGGGGAGPGQAGGSPDQDPEAFTWWMDVHSPTDEEMRMLSKVFGIHPLTTEDILLEETREKIELFRNYYLVCFRSFDQDPYSQTYLEPLNMYIIVFREGTLSFHFRGTPHPQNVRRRIKQLKDYISVTSDWISYALIDDITDAFGPLIQSIEYEVDSIDELVLIIKDAEQSDMLRRIGTCRKKVMGLLRLMGNKADVVKGLAKRCNEQWLVAPKSDIGLYLSDIQDHLITMTQNLNHYEKILSRSHSNYLAQISIEMTDANNQINDVLSKLTALGTVLIPMNLVTGLWGMNVHVPGQDIETGYTWFASILGGLCAFAILGAFATYKCFVTR